MKSKLAQSLLEYTTSQQPQQDWYGNLAKRFEDAYNRGDFESLSRALGHDPEEDDNLDPEELEADSGWAWDMFREHFKNPVDQVSICDLGEWVGLDLKQFCDTDLDVLMEEVKRQLTA